VRPATSSRVGSDEAAADEADGDGDGDGDGIAAVVRAAGNSASRTAGSLATFTMRGL